MMWVTQATKSKSKSVGSQSVRLPICSQIVFLVWIVLLAKMSECVLKVARGVGKFQMVVVKESLFLLASAIERSTYGMVVVHEITNDATTD